MDKSYTHPLILRQARHCHQLVLLTTSAYTSLQHCPRALPWRMRMKFTAICLAVKTNRFVRLHVFYYKTRDR